MRSPIALRSVVIWHGPESAKGKVGYSPSRKSRREVDRYLLPLKRARFLALADPGLHDEERAWQLTRVTDKMSHFQEGRRSR